MIREWAIFVRSDGTEDRRIGIRDGEVWNGQMLIMLARDTGTTIRFERPAAAAEPTPGGDR